MIIIEEPPAAAVSVAEVKAFLRVGHDEEDVLLGALIGSASGICEAFTGLALLPRGLSEILPARGTWTRLGAGPVRSIEGVAALDGEGEAEALAAGAWAGEIDAHGDGWVRVTRATGTKRVKVSYEAGLAAEAEGLPEALRHGIVKLAAHLYAHRHDRDGKAPPAAVTALWRPWRRLRLR